MDTGPGLRWFLSIRGPTGGEARGEPEGGAGRGFKSKASANQWIDSHRPDMDWRCGYAFALRGSRLTYWIVDRAGKLCKP